MKSHSPMFFYPVVLASTENLWLNNCNYYCGYKMVITHFCYSSHAYLLAFFTNELLPLSFYFLSVWIYRYFTNSMCLVNSYHCSFWYLVCSKFVQWELLQVGWSICFGWRFCTPSVNFEQLHSKVKEREEANLISSVIDTLHALFH